MPNNVACRKRADTWSYRFAIPAPGGKYKEITKSGFKTKKEAYAAGIKALNEYNGTGKVSKVSSMLYADLLDKWLEKIRLESKESTYDTYKNNVDHLIKPKLGSIPISRLDTDQLQDVLNGLFIDKYAHSRLISVKSNISSSLKYAKKLGYIQVNPAAELEVPGKTENARDNVESRSKEREVVSPEVWSAIIKRFPEGTPCHIPLVLAYRCGLRRGEAFGLTWDNVDFGSATLTIDHQVQYSKSQKCFRITKPKYNSVRTIELDKDTMELLRRTRLRQLKDIGRYGEYYIRQYVDEKGYINPAGKGNPVMFVNQEENGKYIDPFKIFYILKVIQGKTKSHSPAISETFDYHSLRHTHATMLLEAGLDIKYVSERLGHKDVQTTLDIYTHLTSKMRDTNRSKLDQLYQAK